MFLIHLLTNQSGILFWTELFDEETIISDLEIFFRWLEYFIFLTIFIVFLSITLIAYNNSFGLILQKALSECIALIVLISCSFDSQFYFSEYERIFEFYASLNHDFFVYYMKFLICVFSSLYLFLFADFLKEQKLISFEYLIVIFFAIFGFLLMCASCARCSGGIIRQFMGSFLTNNPLFFGS